MTGRRTCALTPTSRPQRLPEKRRSSKVGGMQGLHLTADLYNCRCAPAWLRDAGQLGPWCAAAARAAGFAPLGEALATHPGGVSATLVMAGAHVAVHTWPAHKAVTLDVYAAPAGPDAAARAGLLLQALAARFAPEWTEQRSLERGGEA